MASIITSGLCQAHKEALAVAGFTTLEEVAELGGVDLMKELRCSKETAAEILAAVAKGGAEAGAGSAEPSAEPAAAHSAKTALELLQACSSQHIVSFCKPLDDLLGGGVACGEVTEFCGIPGVGKTQLCMQLAADAAVPRDMGGVGGATLYIDTEGSFIAPRQHQIAAALCSHLEAMSAKRARPEGGGGAQGEEAGPPTVPTAEEVLSNIHVIRATTATEQLAAVMALPKLLETLTDVRLVILDSVAFHFRHSGGKQDVRSHTVKAMARGLTAVASSHDVAVVVTNHMTHRRDANSGAFTLVPALGETWSHACTTRVLLHWEGALRAASVVKSSTRPPGACIFSVTAEGIRRIRTTASA